MGVIEGLLRFITEVTGRLDEEVEAGYNLERWGDQMKFLHALQLQAQALIDLFQRACALLGRIPSTYIESGRILVEKGLLTERDFRFYRSVVGFRNVLVHGYTRVNLEMVREILEKKLYRSILVLANKVYGELKRRGLDP